MENLKNIRRKALFSMAPRQPKADGRRRFLCLVLLTALLLVLPACRNDYIERSDGLDDDFLCSLGSDAPALMQASVSCTPYLMGKNGAVSANINSVWLLQAGEGTENNVLLAFSRGFSREGEITFLLDGQPLSAEERAIYPDSDLRTAVSLGEWQDFFRRLPELPDTPPPEPLPPLYVYFFHIAFPAKTQARLEIRYTRPLALLRENPHWGMFRRGTQYEWRLCADGLRTFAETEDIFLKAEITSGLRLAESSEPPLRTEKAYASFHLDGVPTADFSCRWERAERPWVLPAVLFALLVLCIAVLLPRVKKRRKMDG